MNKIAVIGLGYVGFPLLYELNAQNNVIGFDINEEKVNLYKNGVDPTNEIGSENLKNHNLNLTSNKSDIKDCNVYIVAVPTPVIDKKSDLTPIIKSSELLSEVISNGDLVIYESTVAPGTTEEICGPILEQSGLKSGVDFFLGYSPERINPGDKVHTLKTTTKIIAAQNEKALNIMESIYSTVVDAGLYKASNIKVAEAAKIIENTQRDINIAFVNELSVIFDKLDIDTKEVLEAAGTKWNFLKFTPGLVGGHCIGVDPYYLAEKAQNIGVNPQIILAGRNINDNMANTIAHKFIEKLKSEQIENPKVAILGLTFKENCPDMRNSKVQDIYKELIKNNIKPILSDEFAEKNEFNEIYPNENLVKMNDLKDLDGIIIAVSHDYIIENIEKLINNLNENTVVFDLKWTIQNKDKFKNYWRM